MPFYQLPLSCACQLVIVDLYCQVQRGAQAGRGEHGNRWNDEERRAKISDAACRFACTSRHAKLAHQHANSNVSSNGGRQNNSSGNLIVNRQAGGGELLA